MEFRRWPGSLITSPVRSYANPGTYTVTLKIINNLGCTDSVSKQVTVLPNTLTGSIVGGPLQFCQGDSVTLNCNATGGYPGYQYLWNTVQITQSIYAAQTGTYRVQLTDSKGCFYIVPPVNVIVNPTPMPIITYR